ncbi:cytochrome P450 [Salinarimonas soli]|uniref:Cytochrome P450 n=1 Tax=Salinarimonas soli TaxID=1638099 RepID=A0A5B2VGE0_9HYPH|nr:cytochrome P450 [Salinarimonas soli]KAA2237975.1 cytochrome P450 [Salinarimonas soli]
MPIPRDPSPDSTLALLREGYAFIPERCRRLGSDLFETRLMFTKAVCMSGPEAAAQFYRRDRFTRRGGMPITTLTLIQDVGSVITLDGDDHRRRKAMFLAIMGPGRLEGIAERTAEHWRAGVRAWERRDEVALFHAAHEPLCGAICEWAGLPLQGDEVAQRAREFEAMVEGTGSVGPRNWRGHAMRFRTERWMRGVIRRIRSGELAVPEGSAAHVVAHHRDRDGELLPVPVAAVELINVLRPTVANARFVAYAAHALHLNPAWRERLRASDEDLELFVQEVRRFYPFIPLIGGRVIEPFSWRGHEFGKDDWVLIDLYGTNRDGRTWEEPDAFRPDRFRGRAIGSYDMIPQGGGDHADTHRCPGEWLLIEQLKTVVRGLTREMTYDVPDQDLGIDLGRMPALPNSRFVMRNVRAAA